MEACQPQADNAFGPRVVVCRGGFDFTLLFEQSIFSLLPSGILILAAILYGAIYLYRQDRKTDPHAKIFWRLSKQIPIICFIATQLALVVLWTSPERYPTQLSLPASCLSLAVGVVLSLLSFYEHDRSVRPSTLISIYLLPTTLFDVAQARTLWLRDSSTAISSVFTAGLALKMCILCLEIKGKRHILKETYRNYSPESLAGIVNRGVFWWLNRLLIKGSSTVLAPSDLFRVDRYLTSDHVQPIFRQKWALADKKGSNSLLFMTAVCLWKPIIAIIIPRLLLIGFNISQPLLTYRVLSLLSDGEGNSNAGRALIGATALIYTGIALSTACYQHNTYRFITMVRSGLIGLIFDTTLHIDERLAADNAAVTLMSTDIERIASGLELVDKLWAGAIQVGLSVYLLYAQIGVSCVAPIILGLAFVISSASLSGLSASAQKTWMEVLEQRVATTSSALANIKGIKMMGLSESVASNLHRLRVLELQVSSRFRKIFALTTTFAMLSESTLPVITMITYVLATRASTGINLDPSLAFTSISLITLIGGPIQQMSRAFTTVAAGVGCFQRVQKYLTSPVQDRSPMEDAIDIWDEKKSNMHLFTLKEEGKDWTIDDDCLLRVESADFAYQPDVDPVIQNVSVEITAGTFTVILGPVGSGKSTLLLALLNELYRNKGSFIFSPSLQISYCAQDPWLPRMTIRQIIIGCSEYDANWYSTIIDACALRQDVDRLPQGDMTMVGSKGASMSGGQKQRLSLARAIYSRKQLLVLDDVFSGLDSTTEKTIFDSVFGPGGLCRKIGTTVVLVTHAVRHAQHADYAILMAPGGTIATQGSPNSIGLFQETDDPVVDRASADNQSGQDMPIAQDIGEQQPSEEEEMDLQAQFLRQSGDTKIYGYYIKAIGFVLMAAILLCNALSAVSLKLPTLWIRWWSNAETDNPGVHTDMYMGVYGSYSAILLICVLGSVNLTLHIAIPRSAISLHGVLLKAVMEAPYWFFVTTDSGHLVSRFSQDMSLIDMELPFSVLDLLFTLTTCLVEAGLIMSASKWAAIMVPFLFLALYVVQKFYLRTSRQLRLLDLEMKSPLYSHFLETLQGLTTIRAFGWQNSARAQNSALLDSSQRSFYLMYSIQRWLTFVLGMVVATVATVIMAVATQVSGASAGSLGVSLVNILSFSQSISFVILSWTNMETSLGAIARLKTFEEDTPNEHLQGETTKPPPEWPTKGHIKTNNLVASYRGEAESILKGITLEIQPGQKVGICGRTGSGKSTFLLALLRLVEIQQGDIEIDGMPLSNMPRDIVRRGITVIPQDPLLLTGTVRYNADPFSKNSDEAIVEALKEVGLWSILSARGGLDTQLESTPLSRGEQQLFCLARAVLVQSPIVALDEVTANIDSETELKMMAVINSRFEGRTVLAVAHHLHTIRHYDRIIVMDQGTVAESGEPDELLSRASLFRALWESQQ